MAYRYGPDVIDAVLFDRGEPLGVLSVPEEELPRIGEAIRTATGIEYQPAVQTTPGVYDVSGTDMEKAKGDSQDGEYDLHASCTVERPRPCELTIGIGRIADLAQEAGVSAQELLALEAKGEATEQEAYEAARSVIERMPCGGPRYEAEIWYDVVGTAPDAPDTWPPLPPSTCPAPVVEEPA